MAAGAVPVALDGLGGDRGVHPEVLGDAVQQVAGHPHLVATSSGPSGPIWYSHWPSITSALVPEMPRPACEAGVGVRLDDVASGDLDGADAAVVRALRGGVVVALDSASRADDPPRRRCTPARCRTTAPGRRTSRRSACSAARVFVGCGSMVSGSSTSQSTRMSSASAERVGAGEDRLQHAVRGGARGLVGRRTVEAPDAGLLAVLDDLGLGAHHAEPARSRRSRCIQPGMPLGHPSMSWSPTRDREWWCPGRIPGTVRATPRRRRVGPHGMLSERRFAPVARL